MSYDTTRNTKCKDGIRGDGCCKKKLLYKLVSGSIRDIIKLVIHKGTDVFCEDNISISLFCQQHIFFLIEGANLCCSAVFSYMRHGVMLYGDFGSVSGLYELGQAVLGREYIFGMSGTIEIYQSEG